MKRLISKIISRFISKDPNPLNLKFVQHDFRQDSKAFKDLVAKVLTENQFDEIIESGTALGDGSTQIFAQYGVPIKTIECNDEFYKTAIDNLKQYDHVELIHGMSLNKKEIRSFIENDRDFLENPGDVYSDNPNPVQFYLDETNYQVEQENVLEQLIDNDKKQLIFLDSCGGMGFLEFNKVLKSKHLRNKALLLDDVDHVKHFRSLKSLKEQSYHVIMSEDNRSCFCGFEQKMNEE